jgi:type IV secretion system protein VirB6
MGFFQTFWSWLNEQLGSYIADNTARVAAAIEPAVVMFATLYVMSWGYLQLTGRIDEPISTGLNRIVRLTVVLGVSLHLWLYNDVMVDSFYRAPAQLASAVVGATDPVASVDAIWAQGGAVADVLFKQGHYLTSVGFWIMGCLVWLLIGLLCVYVMFLIALSSIASAVLLAIGPLFIALWLFDSTRRFFEAWVAQLANYALISILTVLMSALMLHIMQSYAAQTAARGSATQIVDALDMMLMAGLVFLMMRQVMPLAAGLAGGIALSSFNSISRTLYSASPGRRARDYALGLSRKAFEGAIAGGATQPARQAQSLERGTRILNPDELPAERE